MIKKRIRPSRGTFRRLRGRDHSAQSFDISRFKKVNEALITIKPTEPAQRLHYEGAVRIEALVIAKMFDRLYNIQLTRQDIAEMKYWDSPIIVLKAFVDYCLKYEAFFVNLLLSKEQILALFILNASDHIAGQSVEIPLELKKQMMELEASEDKIWRMHKVLMAISSAKQIHDRSISVMRAMYKQKEIVAMIYPILKLNYALCYDKLKRKMCG